MPARSLYRLSGFAAILAGALLALMGVAFVLRLFIGDAALVVNSALYAIGSVCKIFAIFGLFACQFRPLGKTGLIGFALLITGNVIQLSPLLGQSLVLIGLLLFGIANHRVGLLPSWGVWLWLGGSALALAASALGLELVLATAAMINAAALIGLGTALRRAFAAPVESIGFAE